MKRWSSDSVYNARPWVMVGCGIVLCTWAMVMSVMVGEWTTLRGFGCFVGAALVIAGGAILQLRQTYRANSKWRRTTQR
jgi:hypothetical protein